MKVYRHEQNDQEKAASKRGRAARRKGHDFEREIVNRLQSVLPAGFMAQRMLQSRGGGSLPDVEIYTESGALVHIECKKGKRPNIPNAYDQAFKDHKPATTPVAVTRADRSFTLVTLRWTDFVDMLIPYLKGLDND
jgi:hypothetical protein